MKLDGATIPLERRRFGDGVDLAAKLWRAEIARFLSMTAVFAIPSCALVYELTRRFENGIAWSFATLFTLSPVFGAWLVAGIGPRVFGEEFRLSAAWARLRPVLSRVLLGVWIERVVWVAAALWGYSLEPALGYTILGFFLLLRAYRSALVREVVILEGLEGKPLRRRLADLRSGSSGTQQAWALGAICVGGFLVIALFALLVEVLSWTFGLSVLGSGFGIGQEFELRRLFAVLDYQPIASTVILAVFWFVYPFARLIMFLVYLDLRIQRECWDLEIDFRVEAAKIRRSR